MTDKIEQILNEAREKRNRGKYDEAKELLVDAIIKTKRLNVVQLGNLLHALGKVEQAAESFIEAWNYFNTALSRRQEAGDLLGAAYTAFQIPMCRRAAGQPDDFLIEEFRRARDAINEAIKNPEHVSPKDMGNMIHNLGFCMQVERNWQGAMKNYAEALRYRHEASDRRGAAMTLARKAECLIELGDKDGARENAQTALKIFQDIGDLIRIKQV